MAKILKGNEFKDKLNLRDRLSAGLSSALGAEPDLSGVIDREILAAGSQAKAIVFKAKEDANRLRQEGKELLDQVKDEKEKAKKEGYEQGYQEGLENALEMLTRVKELRAKLFADSEQEIIKLVFEIAKKVIGIELRKDDQAITNVIRLALSDAVGPKITVKLNPQDYEILQEKEEAFLKTIENGDAVVFRPDDAVQQYGCVVDTEIGTIDAQLETQLNAIKKALGI